MLTPPRSREMELIDVGAPSREDLVANLQDMSVANRLMGTSARVVGLLQRLLADGATVRTLSLLDIGTGGADVPLDVIRWADRAGVGMRVMVSDVSGEVLSIAKDNVLHHVKNHCIQAPVLLRHDGTRVPFEASSVDLVTCCNTLHHLARDEAVALLREAERVSRLGFVVLDVRRSLFTYWASRLLATFLCRHRLSRHDGPLSVLRSYTRSEMTMLATEAAIPCFEVHEYLWHVVVLRDKGAARAGGCA